MPCERIPPCAPTGDCREMRMSEALRFTITHFHNQVRATTATTTPGAAKMRALKYNRDLETVAQCWINTCTLDKSACLVTPQFKTFGQNLGSIDIFDRSGLDPTSDPASLWQEMMTVWTDEVNNINADIIQKLPAPEETYRYEHYTQIVTDYTSHLGCAWSVSNESIHFACFYGPPGGIKDNPVYEFGPFCSKCPEGTECYRPLGLCAQIETGVQHWKLKMKASDSFSRCENLSSLEWSVYVLSLMCLVGFFFEF
ncbi:scoloptoxin SSD976-like [Coccinella septempunctata]|uniref:scoloptoxin SSD976-like n=1 Tax=Coccinella septempunctata TaxID=41139 RepID=UPI001D07BC42|nr:scoloptoxin SSD976-like [Coccinella septempunctata]